MKAFPHSFERVPNHPRFAESEGMDLRDYFAAKAMQGMLAYSTNNEMSGNWSNNASSETVAKGAYEYADAMMKAREAK